MSLHSFSSVCLSMHFPLSAPMSTPICSHPCSSHLCVLPSVCPYIHLSLFASSLPFTAPSNYLPTSHFHLSFRSLVSICLHLSACLFTHYCPPDLQPLPSICHFIQLPLHSAPSAFLFGHYRPPTPTTTFVCHPLLPFLPPCPYA